MSWMISGLVGGAVATAIGTVALRTRKAARIDANGWKSLRPGWCLHLLVLGCLAFAGAIGYFFWLGGSTRADAGEQNLLAFCLLVASAGAGTWVYCGAYLRKTEWACGVIRIRSPWHQEVSHRFSDVLEMRELGNGNGCTIRFADGRSLSVSVYSEGYHDLLEDLDKAFSGRPTHRTSARAGRS